MLQLRGEEDNQKAHFHLFYPHSKGASLSTLSTSSLEYLSFPLISDMLENIQQLTFWGLKPPRFSICLLWKGNTLSVQFSPTLCDPVEHSTPGFPVHHQLLELVQTHVHWVSDAIQPSHPLSSPSPPTFNLSQHQGLFQWVSFSHQVAKVLELLLQHQSFQWILRTDLL